MTTKQMPYFDEEKLREEERFDGYYALVIARLLAHCLGNQFSISRIVESLNNASGSRLEENWYVFDYADEIAKAIHQTFGIDLTRKQLRLGDIKKLLGPRKGPDFATTYCKPKKPPKPCCARLRRLKYWRQLQKSGYVANEQQSLPSQGGFFAAQNI